MTIDSDIPGLCTALTRHVYTMWSKALNVPLAPPLATLTTTPETQRTWENKRITNFWCATNKMLFATVTKERKVQHIPEHIGADMNAVMASWKPEARTMFWLAPTRKGSLMRIKRNKLQLAFMGQACGENYRTQGPLCSQNKVEDAGHLF